MKSVAKCDEIRWVQSREGVKQKLRKLKSCVRLLCNLYEMVVRGHFQKVKSGCWIAWTKTNTKTKTKTKAKTIAHHRGPIFGFVFSSSSEVLESRWPEKASHLPKSLIAVHKDQMSLATEKKKQKPTLTNTTFAFLSGISRVSQNYWYSKHQLISRLTSSPIHL